MWYYDEPFGDASAVPSYAIAELTRQHVTVVLNGDGGDENFAGYDRYITDRLLRHGDIVPLSLRRAFAALLKHVPAGWRQRQPLQKLAKIAVVMAQTAARRYARLGGHFTPEERQLVYGRLGPQSLRLMQKGCLRRALRSDAEVGQTLPSTPT